jgi:ubiquinone/menaquinone biosynthesis C-methylase UbiE
MNRDWQENREVVERAYTELAQKDQNCPTRYDIEYQISKMLSDYILLSKVNLVDKQVLNIGCFEPLDEIFWVNLVKEWHALDINESVIEMAKRSASEALPLYLYSKLKFIIGDVTNLDLEDESYDVVVSFSTIDHITGKENRVKAISEMFRVLKRGGYLVITVPNSWDFYYSYHSNKCQREGKAIFGYEYQFSPLELKRMLTMNGFKIINCASTAFNPYSYFDRLLKKLGIPIVYFGTRFGYLAQKK